MTQGRVAGKLGAGVVFRLDLQRSVLQMPSGGTRHPWWVHVWMKEQTTSKQNPQMAFAWEALRAQGRLQLASL